MTSLRTRALLTAPVVTLALALLPVAAASAHDGGHSRTLIEADLTPSLPTDAPIAGVRPGAAAWVLGEGEVRVGADGDVRIELEGLQIPRADGTRDNPIASVVASLFCGGTLAARTAPQPMTVPGGNARIHVSLPVPMTCDLATVLISPAANTRVYIASATAEADAD